MTVTLRPYRGTDAPATREVFQAAIRRTATAYYSAAQIDAWCPPGHDAAAWAAARARAWTVVAEAGGEVVGFSDLTAGGVLDMLFVHPDSGRRGVARALVGRVLEEAARRGLPEVTTRASRAARPALERLGFVVDEEDAANTVRGVVVPNFRMHVDLT